MLDSLLAPIAPHSCSGCGNVGSILCDTCKYDIVSEPYSLCISCMMPCAEGNLCGSCTHAFGVAGVWCVGTRTDSLKRLLDRYKFESARAAGATAASLLDARLPLLNESITITAVPTAAANQRSRGFDHTARIARYLARLRATPYKQMLRRRDNTTQHFQRRADRMKLSADSFEVIGDVPSRVLLIDDIYTTGATVRACVDALKSGGADEVYVAIIARQTLDEDRHL